MLTVFGSVAVAGMLVFYWLEPRSRWYTLCFAGGSAATALYSGLIEAYPIMAIEAVWTLASIQRFLSKQRALIGTHT